MLQIYLNNHSSVISHSDKSSIKEHIYASRRDTNHLFFTFKNNPLCHSQIKQKSILCSICMYCRFDYI